MLDRQAFECREELGGAANFCDLGLILPSLFVFGDVVVVICGEVAGLVWGLEFASNPIFKGVFNLKKTFMIRVG